MICGGVDIGVRRVAISIPTEQTYQTFALKLARNTLANDEDVALALRQTGWWIQRVVPPRVHLLVERPVFTRSKNTFARMYMTAAAVMTAHTGPSTLISNSAWKAATVGDGSASKDEIAAWLARSHPAIATACLQDQDLADAACLAVAGNAGLLPLRGMPRA